MKVLHVILALVCCLLLSCEKQLSTKAGPVSPLSAVQAEKLAAEVNEAGGEASQGVDGSGWSFSVDDTPEKCLPISNKIPSIDTFYIRGSELELSVEHLHLLEVRDETREFRILYGSLDPDAFAVLPKTFPDLRELILWSPSGSDISRLDVFPQLAKFISDYDNLITVEEARRLRHQESLTSVHIEKGESEEVFSILKELPLIEELSVSVTLGDGEGLDFEL